MATLRGYVGKVIHQGERFFVLSFDVDHTEPPVSEKRVTVSGHLYGLTQIRAGISVQLVGDWVRHPKYGRQFSPYGWFPWATSDLSVERFLTECVEGFSDESLVQKIVSAFGTLTFEKLTDSPNQVLDLIPDKESPQRLALENALFRWNEARALSNLSIFLQDYDLSEEVVRQVFAQFGMDAVTLISENPYRLVAVEGFPFAKADRLAKRTGIKRDDPRRLDGAVLWILRKEAQNGHLSVRRGDFSSLIIGLSDDTISGSIFGDVTAAQLMDAVTRLEQVGAVKVDPNVGVYLPSYYKFEREGAVKLAEFLTPAKIDIDLDSFLVAHEKSNQINFSEAQRDALYKLIENRVLILTGLPGTGKSLLINSVVRLFKQTGKSFALMAPTGIAAKRLSALTGEPASTIHRSFGYDGQLWAYNHRNKFGIDAVIIDEISMTDMELFYRILDALHPSTLLLLVGDDAQLPSVGPGNVLRELLNCSAIPHVRLTQIFRQSKQSEIVVASHKINRGESPQLENIPSDSEFQFVPVHNEDRITSLIVQMAVKLKGRDANFQVLSPKYDGGVGINALNELLREQLNPHVGQNQCQIGKFGFREGDRVMVIKNDYKLNVSNGDMGKLASITRDTLKVRIHGIGHNAPDSYVDIPKSRCISMLRLAYAISIHKSQGAEFDTVILPMTRSQGRMLQRNLIYTAITRAKKKVWVIGESTAVFKAIGNDRVVQRNTALGAAVLEAAKKCKEVT